MSEKNEHDKNSAITKVALGALAVGALVEAGTFVYHHLAGRIGAFVHRLFSHEK